jgi:hypothetical protein
MHPDVPIVVDLDGTFFTADSLRIGRVRVSVLRPHRLWGLRRARRSGKDVFKEYVWKHAKLRIEGLSVNTALLDWLSGQRALGREVILATGSAQGFADAVVQHYPVFTSSLGTVPGTNLTGATKANALVALFGERGFDYAGNARADLLVWQHARRAILCNTPEGVALEARALCPIEIEFHTTTRAMTRPWRVAYRRLS